MKDTSQKGLVSHTAVLNRLVQLGYEVLLPWADHLGYDLAYYVTEEHRSFGFFVHEELRLIRIQVKTAWLSSDGCYLMFNTQSTVSAKRGNKKLGYEGKIEYFAVYSPDTTKVYIIPITDIPKTSPMNLRFKSAGILRRGKGYSRRIPYCEEIAHECNWAEDYEL